tara:strand:+ start:3408 stop:4163 length:756 start_codon:yes stop_codon:yes gene_type:complete
MVKIAILIPSTSKKRNWKNYKESDFFKITLSSFLKTMDKEHTYTFFIGYDEDDAFFLNKRTQLEFQQSVEPPITIEFYQFPKSNGNVVYIWNELFKKAFYSDVKYDYFHQTGDDIEYMDKGWTNECITEIKKMDDVGVVGHTDWGRRQYNSKDCLLTQSFVGRSHYEMLGYYFHPYLRNWYCDNYITDLYCSAGRFKQIEHRIQNKGGEPRYEIHRAGELEKECVISDLPKIPYYMEIKKRQELLRLSFNI